MPPTYLKGSSLTKKNIYSHFIHPFSHPTGDFKHLLVLERHCPGVGDSEGAEGPGSCSGEIYISGGSRDRQHVTKANEDDSGDG